MALAWTVTSSGPSYICAGWKHVSTTKPLSASFPRERGLLQANLRLCLLVAVGPQEKLSFHEKKGVKQPLFFFAGLLRGVMIMATEGGRPVCGSYYTSSCEGINFMPPKSLDEFASSADSSSPVGGVFLIL